MLNLQTNPTATKNANIAVVEDEQCLRNDLVEYLSLRGFSVQGFDTAAKLYRELLGTQFDLFLLDINLPEESGIEAMEWLRTCSQAGIIMITASTDNNTQLTCLYAGADAYLTKSASLEVIEATCHSVLRRLSARLEVNPVVTQTQVSEPKPQTWLLHKTTWHLETPYGYQLPLNQTEMIFLATLFQRAGTPVSRADLLVRMGKSDTLSNLRNLDNCASRLRKKILNTSTLEIPIRTTYAVGYIFAGNGGIIDN